jgi:hypothetical protein
MTAAATLAPGGELLAALSRPPAADDVRRLAAPLAGEPRPEQAAAGPGASDGDWDGAPPLPPGEPPDAEGPQPAPPPLQALQAPPPLPPEEEAAPGGGAGAQAPAAPWGPPAEFVPGAEAACEVLAPFAALPPGALRQRTPNHRALRELCSVALLVGGARAIARVGAEQSTARLRRQKGTCAPVCAVLASCTDCFCRVGVPTPRVGRVRSPAQSGVRWGVSRDRDAAAGAPLTPLPLSLSGSTWGGATTASSREAARSLTAARGSAPSRWSMCSRCPRRPPSGWLARRTRGRGPFWPALTSSAARRWD